MPDLYRGTFIMNGRGQGWSESYVFPLDGVNVGIFASTVMQPLAVARARLLASEYTLQAFRTTKIRLADGTPVTRNSDLNIVNLGINAGISGWEGCQPNECVIVNGVSADGSREKKVFMRGIPDIVITNGGTLNNAEPIGWFSRLASFTNQLVARQAGWLQDVAQGNKFNVTNYTVTDGFQVQVTFSGNIFNGLIPTNRVPVRLARINGKSELNGIQMMIVDSNTQGTTVDAFSLFPYQFGGTGVRMTDPKPFISAVAWGAELARTHQTGKVSISTRGRAPARPKG